MEFKQQHLSHAHRLELDISTTEDTTSKDDEEERKGWSSRRDDLAYVVTSLSGLYAIILVSVYMSFIFTELVTFPKYQLYLEKNGFFIYLFSVSDVFLLYVLFFTMRRNGTSSRGDPRVVENHKSHGSLTVRFGALVFGLGAIIYFILEFIAFFEVKMESPCYFQLLGANIGLAIIFIILQTYLIFMYPRLNLRIVAGLDSFGTMHLVATNIILWIRTLVKESLHEIAEFEEESHEEVHADTLHGKLVMAHQHSNCNFFGDRILQYELEQLGCMKHRDDILGDALIRSSPYLYPFVIEYTLISASVVFLMWMHVGKLPRTRSQLMTSVIRRPQPAEFLRKGNWSSHTLKGMLAGLTVFSLAITNLGLFFGLTGQQNSVDSVEYYSKMVNTVTNTIGILALIIGLAQIQLLPIKKTGQGDEGDISDQLDLSLLRFTAFFSYLYHNFTVITGSFNKHVMKDFPNALHIVNGVVEAGQITLQLIFLTELKKRELSEARSKQMPGRQVTVFLFLLNLSQWIVTTFEIQKVRASLVEANFYGFMPWVVIQRVTLPLAVFFRFHSSVVSIELWREICGEG